MSRLTALVAIGSGGMKFTRVMAGEYFCDTAAGRYSIDHTVTGCDDCDHKHEYWKLTFWRYELGRYPTLTDAKIAANEHYEAK
ncbi:hypothetical protein [Mycobacterium phage WXIN]|nr:hypothetical protein [Mycobacterium phage WXIN]